MSATALDFKRQEQICEIMGLVSIIIQGEQDKK